MFTFRVKINSFKNKIEKLQFSGWLKILFGIFIGFVFIVFLYFGFYRLFIYVQKFQIIGSLLLLKLLEIIFLTTFIMVIFSSIIISFSTIFFSDELKLLLTLPVHPYQVFLTKTFDTMIQSSWMMIVTIIPFLMAFAKVKNAGIEFFAIFSLFSIPFLFISVTAGILITSGIMLFFPSSRARDIVLFLAIIIGSVGYVGFRFLEPEKLANPDRFYDAMHYIAYLNAPITRILPSWWFTESLNGILTKNADVVLKNSFLFLLAGGLCLLILVIFSEKFYYRILTNLRLGRAKKKWHELSAFSQFNSKINFISKDIKIFFRDPKQWSQVLLVIALVIVYLFSIYRLPKSFAETNYPVFYICNFLVLFNIGAGGFILSALALRFVYPQISLEKGTLWFFLSIPESIEKLFIKKFFPSLVLIILIGLVIGMASNILLNVSSYKIFIFSSVVIIVISFGLVCLASGFGTIYPRFDTENIAQIETSFGGILYMLSALAYIGLTLAIIYKPFILLIKHEMGLNIYIKDLVWYFIDFLVLNLVAIFLPIYFGLKSLKNFELREWSG
ncbi:MAG: putative ABC transporter permease subunit [Endomicrobiia bacterium]